MGTFEFSRAAPAMACPVEIPHFRYADHDEVFTAGDAYYGAPGHLPLLFAGTELVEFSPTGPLTETMGVIGKNLEAARAAGLAGGA